MRDKQKYVFLKKRLHDKLYIFNEYYMNIIYIFNEYYMKIQFKSQRPEAQRC